MNEAEPPRTKSLWEHFSEIRDSRQPCKVMYRLSEVLLLVVCGTMAACDDYDDIVLWGKKHLNFLRGLQEYHHGIPCADWLRVVMNRIDPELFASCFLNFAGERLPGAVGQAALHLVSAYATTHSLVLGQRAVADKSNEITAIPLLLDELAASGALTGSLVSIDAMGCQSGIAEKPVRHRGEASQASRRRLSIWVGITFWQPRACPREGGGQPENRRHLVSQRVDWMSGKQRYPDEARFKGPTTIAMIETRIEVGGEIKTERRCYISSRVLTAKAFAGAACAHTGLYLGNMNCG